jgi:hypothetical protein
MDEIQRGAPQIFEIGMKPITTPRPATWLIIQWSGRRATGTQEKGGSFYSLHRTELLRVVGVAKSARQKRSRGQGRASASDKAHCHGRHHGVLHRASRRGAPPLCKRSRRTALLPRPPPAAVSAPSPAPSPRFCAAEAVAAPGEGLLR